MNDQNRGGTMGAGQGKDKADRPDKSPAGQQKTYQVTNPATGETRTVTQQQWRDEKLGQAGWQKPADLDDTDTPGA